MRSRFHLKTLIVSLICICCRTADAASGSSMDGWHNAPPPSRIKYRVFNDKTVELANISKSCGGNGNLYHFIGKISEVIHSDGAINVKGFVLEDEGGNRESINVEVVSIFDDDMDLFDFRWIQQGFEEIIRTNAYVEGETRNCEVGENLMVLDRINLVPRIALPPATPPRSEISLIKQGGTYKVPVVINGSLNLNFTVDSGAADVSIPADVVLVMIRTGTLTDDDFLETQTYVLADAHASPHLSRAEGLCEDVVLVEEFFVFFNERS